MCVCSSVLPDMTKVLSAVRNPVLVDLPDIELELVDSRTFDGRVQQLVYMPRGPRRHS